MLLQERVKDHEEQTCAGEDNPEPVFSNTPHEGNEVNLHTARLKDVLFVSQVLFTLQSECLLFVFHVYILFCYHYCLPALLAMATYLPICVYGQ